MTHPNAIFAERRARKIVPVLLAFAAVCGVVLVSMLVLFPGNATPVKRENYTYLSVVSPEAHEIRIADTERLDDVVQILRANDATFEGPVPEVVNDSGEPRTVGYKLIVRLNTYNPRGATDPGCPYQQVTDLRYDLQGRLYVYYVSYQPLCIK